MVPCLHPAKGFDKGRQSRKSDWPGHDRGGLNSTPGPPRSQIKGFKPVSAPYLPLTTNSLAGRLAGLTALTDRLPPPAGWTVREVGDGNLNLVFIVTGALRAVIVKQALPYVRLVGDKLAFAADPVVL